MKSITTRVPATPLAVASACAVLLAACGGGGGSSGNAGAGTSTQTTFSGTAATGAAMAGATVRVKCAAGSGSATTGADGNFTLTLSDIALPCVASASSADGATVLHSLANPDGGRTQTLNLNPLTQLVVARLAGAEPAAFYAGFDSAAIAKVNASNILAAVNTVVTTLKDGGIDFTSVGNPITAALVAKTASTTGNAYDQALDLLGTRLAAAGTTLAQLTNSVASAANASAAGNTGLPAAQLLRPANADCAALRSGPYRWINPTETTAAWRSSKAQFDAAALTLTWHDGSTSTATSTGGCTFSANGGQTKMVVSQAGVVVATSLTTTGKQVLSFGFPEQTVQLADLAGSWNVLEFNNVAAAGATPQLINEFTKVDIAADGKITALAECVGLETCATQAGPFGSLALNAAGGFSFSEPAGTATTGDPRAFVFRPANGEPLLMLVSDDNLIVASKVRTLGLPAMGDVSNFWDISSNWQGITSASFIDTSTTVTAVDSTAGSFTRRRTSDGRVDGFTVNKPRNGLRHRPVSTSTLTNGSTVTLTEIITMPLPGTGLTVYGRITTDTTRAAGFFGVSVNKPN